MRHQWIVAWNDPCVAEHAVLALHDEGQPLLIGLERDAQALFDRARVACGAAEPPPTNLGCYWIYSAADRDTRALALKIAQRDPRVRHAYPCTTPTVPPGDVAPPTPSFHGHQFHLLPAPIGVGATDAAQVLGANGAGRRFVDVEWSWHRSHEDITNLQNAPTLGAAPAAALFTDHGTAAIGLVAADPDAAGIRGIAPAAAFALASANTSAGYSVARALVAAQSYLRAGDVLLLEVQARSPIGLVPVEYERAEYDAIRSLVSAGITVIEPAGNGSVDLDDPFFAGIFDRTQRDSGAIVVASSDGVPPQRTNASSYGSRVDVNAFGLGVATTGFGDLFDPVVTPEQRYTLNFGGTSAASAITAGVALQVLGAFDAGARPFGAALPRPSELRDLLRRTGVAPGSARELLQIGTRVDAVAALRASGLMRGLLLHGDTNTGSNFQAELIPRELGFPADGWALFGALGTSPLVVPAASPHCGQWLLDFSTFFALGSGSHLNGANPLLPFFIPRDPMLHNLRIVMQALYWDLASSDICLSRATVLHVLG